MEPQHYDLLSSILKNRPLSQPSLCVLEGTADSQQTVAAIEVDSDRPPFPADKGGPDIPLTSPPVVAPHPAPATRETQEVPPVATGPPPPRRTRKRTIRPSDARKELVKCMKSMEETLKESSQRQGEHYSKLLELTDSMEERDRERHEKEKQMKEESHEMDIEIKRERD